MKNDPVYVELLENSITLALTALNFGNDGEARKLLTTAVQVIHDAHKEKQK
jgi:hypothetical protein